MTSGRASSRDELPGESSTRRPADRSTSGPSATRPLTAVYQRYAAPPAMSPNQAGGYPSVVPFDGLLSPLHWLIIGVVALLVLGPDRLPQAGREAAKAYRFVRDAGSAITNEISGFLGVDSRLLDDRVKGEADDGRPVDWVKPKR